MTGGGHVVAYTPSVEDATMWYRCVIGQHYRVRIEPIRSLGKKVYWTAQVVFVSVAYPQGRVVHRRLVEYSESQLWQRICSAVRKGK